MMHDPEFWSMLRRERTMAVLADAYDGSAPSRLGDAGSSDSWNAEEARSNPGRLFWAGSWQHHCDHGWRTVVVEFYCADEAGNIFSVEADEYDGVQSTISEVVACLMGHKAGWCPGWERK